MFLALAITAQRSVIEMVMQITGNTATLRATSVIAPIALLAVWSLADWGLNVAVLIIFFATAVSNWIAISVLIRSNAEFNVDWRGLSAVSVPAVLVIVLGMLMKVEMSALLVASVAMCLFLLSLWLSKPFNDQELTIVRRVAGVKMARLMGLFSCRSRIQADDA
jgi:hypothetical protein